MHKNRQFKICLVSISLEKGGAERSVAMHSQMLSQLGHQVHIVVLRGAIDFEYSGTIFNLSDLKDSKGKTLNRLRRFKRLRKFLLTENFDVVIDHRSKNTFSKELFYINFIYKNIPKIYVVHSSKQAVYFTQKPAMFARVYNSNLATVTVSKYIENHVQEKLGVANAVTIHNAYNTSWVQEISEEKIIKGTYILSYGRFDDSIKDFKFLMQSFSASRLWEQGVQLVLMGQGKDEKMLKAFASAEISAKQIIFLPFKNNPFSIVKNARCVTLTSKYEGFPMVLVESLSLGTPIVSLDIVSGPSEIIKHEKNGLLISERNIQKFAKALQNICTDESFYRTLKENTKPSVSQFSMDEIGKKWNQLLQDVIH